MDNGSSAGHQRSPGEDPDAPDDPRKSPDEHHRAKNERRRPGRHRKPGRLAVAWRTTGGVVVGAAVLGTAAATAQASVLPFAPALPVPVPATAHVTAGDLKGGKGGASTSKDRHQKKPKGGNKDKPKDGAKADGRNGSGAGQDAPKPESEEKPPEDKRPTADEAINLARSQVGIREDGRGETKFNKWYAESPRAKETVARDGGSVRGYDAAAWCDMFISWVGDQLGFTDQIGSDAWTIAHAKWFRDQGRWGTEPKPGAIVFYAWNGGKNIDDIVHVGMVIKKIDDRTIEAVEGNTDNAVRIRNRSTGTIVGYGYPEYKP